MVLWKLDFIGGKQSVRRQCLFKSLKPEFENSGFKLLNNFKLFSDFNEVQDYSLMMIC